jgi:hypothetical protein
MLLVAGLLAATAESNSEAGQHQLKIGAHITPSILADSCGLPGAFPCNVTERHLTVRGPLGRQYVYLLALDGDARAGLQEVSFGIIYGDSLVVEDWWSCADMEQPGGPPGIVWPDPGSGNRITWSGTHCQRTPAAGDLDGGVTALIGILLVNAYGSDSFTITPRNDIEPPDLRMKDCAGGTDKLDDTRAGYIGFGKYTGEDPCYQAVYTPMSLRSIPPPPPKWGWEEYAGLRKRFEEAAGRIVRLAPSSFPKLPKPITAWMREHGMTVPQSYCDSVAHNVVHGNLDENHTPDWAVLCSHADTSRIVVFWNGLPDRTTALEASPDANFLQTVTEDSVAYSRMLILETPRTIRERYREWESTAPSWVRHDGIGDVFCEKGSSVFYWRNGHLEQLLGAD